LALVAQDQIALAVTSANIMGVLASVSDEKRVTRNALERGYSLANVSSRIEAVAEAFTTQLDLIRELAASEMRLRRLAKEPLCHVAGVGQTTDRPKLAPPVVPQVQVRTPVLGHVLGIGLP
jgi:hypothetical protein